MLLKENNYKIKLNSLGKSIYNTKWPGRIEKVKFKNKYIIFFSTATFNSLNIVDIPKIHFAFIDGSHSFKDVFLEINYLIQRLDNNSILKKK